MSTKKSMTNGDTFWTVSSLHSKAIQLEGERNYNKNLLMDEKKKYKKYKRLLANTLQAQSMLQGIARNMQERAHKQISKVVTKCLQSSFGDAYEFKILFEEKRGKTDARPVFIKDGNETDPMDGSGGGVVDLAAFALRVSSLVLCRPQRRKLLLLDEPFRFVSREYRPAASKILKTISKDLGVQILLVTHSRKLLRIGKVIKIG